MATSLRMLNPFGIRPPISVDTEFWSRSGTPREKVVCASSTLKSPSPPLRMGMGRVSSHLAHNGSSTPQRNKIRKRSQHRRQWDLARCHTTPKAVVRKQTREKRLRIFFFFFPLKTLVARKRCGSSWSRGLPHRLPLGHPVLFPTVAPRQNRATSADPNTSFAPVDEVP